MRLTAVTVLLVCAIAWASPAKGSFVRIKLRSGAIVMGELLNETPTGFLVSNGGKTQLVPFADVVELDELKGAGGKPGPAVESPPPPPPAGPPPELPPTPPPFPEAHPATTPDGLAPTEVTAEEPPPAPRRSWPFVRWVPAIGGVSLAIGGGSLFGLSRVTASGLRSGSRETVHQRVQEGKTFEAAGVALMIVGGAAVAASVVWVFAIPAPPAQVAVVPTPGGGALVMGGTF